MEYELKNGTEIICLDELHNYLQYGQRATITAQPDYDDEYLVKTLYRGRTEEVYIHEDYVKKAKPKTAEEFMTEFVS